MLDKLTIAIPLTVLTLIGVSDSVAGFLARGTAAAPFVWAHVIDIDAALRVASWHLF